MELKYKTKGTRLEFNGEVFDLLQHGAGPRGRYDFLYDIHRLEKVVEQSNIAVAYAVMLTNDSTYWKPGSDRVTIDANLRIHEGRVLHGEHSWGQSVGGTAKDRQTPISLFGTYETRWRDYSQIAASHDCHFKYLVLQIFKPVPHTAQAVTTPI